MSEQHLEPEIQIAFRSFEVAIIVIILSINFKRSPVSVRLLKPLCHISQPCMSFSAQWQQRKKTCGLRVTRSKWLLFLEETGLLPNFLHMLKSFWHVKGTLCPVSVADSAWNRPIIKNWKLKCTLFWVNFKLKLNSLGFYVVNILGGDLNL